MSNDFDRSLNKVLVSEGGYVNDPRDPGGATNKGITQRTYDAYRDRLELPRQPVKNISSQEVAAIYRASYWYEIKGDQLPSGVNYVVFDGAVHSGVAQSIKWLQRALNVVVDGQIGPVTIAAANAFVNDDLLVDGICNRRLGFLKALKTWKTYGKGWSSRVNSVRAIGRAWASNGIEPSMSYAAGGEAKAVLADAKAGLPTAPGDTATGAGGLTVMITQAQEQLTPYVSIGFVAKAAASLTIAGLVVGVSGLAYRVWAKHQNEKLNDALDLKVVQNVGVAA